MKKLVDSGASCSVIDKNTLDNLGSFPISKAIKPLVDASGNSMEVVGSVLLPVHPIGLRKPKLVEFCVTNSKRYSCILLGRNFMSSYKTVLFDFANNRIKLGDTWCTGLSIKHKDCVRLIK